MLVTVVNESYEEQLSSLRVPVRLVWGAEDTEVPLEVATLAADLVAEASVTVLPGVGHHVCIEAPEAVRSAILGAVR